MSTLDVYLVRHAQSVWNEQGIWQGAADPPLSELGRRQAAHLAQHFPEREVRHLLSSDLQRALDTAVPLADRFGVPVTVDPDLRELDVGSWSGRTRAQIKAADPDAFARFRRGEAGWDGGESYEQHTARAEAFVARLDALAAGIERRETLVAVTHGGTLRAIVLAMLGVDPQLRFRFSGIDHTSVTHVRRKHDVGYRLVAYNASLTLEEL